MKLIINKDEVVVYIFTYKVNNCDPSIFNLHMNESCKDAALLVEDSTMIKYIDAGFMPG